MQVVSPIDIEDVLRIDLAALASSYRVFAPPVPTDLQAGDVMITALGGAAVSGSSHEYDVSVDVYEEDEAAAAISANEIHGLVVSLPVMSTSTQYSDARAGLPYDNHDPNAPQLSRRTFRATVICPGQALEF